MSVKTSRDFCQDVLEQYGNVQGDLLHEDEFQADLREGMAKRLRQLADQYEQEAKALREGD